MENGDMLVRANTEMCKLLRLLTVIYSMRKESESSVYVCVCVCVRVCMRVWVSLTGSKT